MQDQMAANLTFHSIPDQKRNNAPSLIEVEVEDAGEETEADLEWLEKRGKANMVDRRLLVDLKRILGNQLKIMGLAQEVEGRAEGVEA